MGSAKDIILRPISRRDADVLVKRVHYSGTVVNNSQLHIGVFYAGRLEGAMQFGPSLDKRKIQGLVTDTPWNGFLELNRMAFSEALPRNSESRAIAVAMRLIRQYAPHIQWVISFADGAQCGDGTIYRAAGFVLTGIKKNNQVWAAPTGAREPRTSLTDQSSAGRKSAARTIVSRVSVTKGPNTTTGGGGASMRQYAEAGFVPIPGHQLRYIYFLDSTACERLTVPILPYSEIARRGAGMYRGQPICAGSIAADAPDNQSGEGGPAPTPALQSINEVAA